MSTLSGQQINQSYQGLIKLSDSSTGLTSTFQTIEDGLGNDTGAKVKSGTFTVPFFTKMQHSGTPFKLGLGISTTTNTNYAVDDYDAFNMAPFYNPGFDTFSSITYNVNVVTSSADVVEFGIYSSQFIDSNSYGLFPYQLVSTGCTLITNSTGSKTTTFTTPISFANFGPGIYFAAIRTTNTGATPTVKFRQNTLSSTLNPTINLYSGFFNTSSVNIFSVAGLSLNIWNGSVVEWVSEFDSSVRSTYNQIGANMQFPGFVINKSI